MPTRAVAAPAWLGDRVIASCRDGRRWRLCEIDPDSRDLRWLSEVTAYAPQPDGPSRIFFTSDADGLLVLHRDRGAVEPAWPGLPRASRTAWAVRNGMLFYLAEQGARPDSALIRRDLASGETVILHEGRFPIFGARLSASSDGGRLAFTLSRAAQDDIQRFPLPELP